ncbi:MAG TPA: YihY/virulence factor BrkB family protein [Euzebyales bacterium]|nr:YihY/virulence factor BrkB family protein [Euzebyales bacterium]
MLRRWLTVVRGVAADTRRRAARQDLMLIAAGLTLYAGIAIVPLFLLGLYGAGLVLGPQQVADLVARLSQYAPEALGAREVLRSLGDVGPRLGLPSLLASIVTATTYGEGLLRAVDTLEGGERPGKTLMGRLRVVPYLGVFPLVTVAGLATVAVLPDALGGGTAGRLLGVYLTFWIGWLSATALLVVLYRLFAGRALRWTAILLGSLATGSFLAGMSLGWVLVLRFGVAIGRAYGGSDELGRIVLFAIYLLLVQIAVLVGYLLVLTIDRRTERGTAGDGAPGPPPGATTPEADRRHADPSAAQGRTGRTARRGGSEHHRRSGGTRG